MDHTILSEFMGPLYDAAGRLLTFAEAAREKFQRASPQVRRELLLALGSNPTLRDQDLSIQLEKTLVPMQRMAREVRRINDRFEPPKNGSDNKNSEQLYARSLNLRCVVNGIRTGILA